MKRHLALLLMLLSIHLLHYASLGGSAALSARNAQEEAQEAAQEAAGIHGMLCMEEVLVTWIHYAWMCVSYSNRMKLLCMCVYV